MSSIDKTPITDEQTPAVVRGYAAVPLDLRAHRQELYRVESLDRIRNTLAAAAAKAMEHDWARSPELADRLVGIMDRSLVESHEKRIFLNRRYDAALLGDTVDMTDERVVRAMNGEASPHDLLEALRDYPALRSVELAKLSHPLNPEATLAMDQDMRATLGKLGVAIAYSAPVYKRKSYHDDLPALTILRKQTLGSLGIPDGQIEVVRRQSFLVRGDDEARENDPYLDRKIRNRDRFNEIAQKIERYLPHIRLHPYVRVYSSIATSYFAWVRKEPRS